MPHVVLSYAPSNRAGCRICLQNIQKNQMRYSLYSARRTYHYHVDCFYGKIPTVLKDCPSMSNLGRMTFKTPTDQKTIEDHVKKAAEEWRKKYGRSVSYPKELALLKANKLHDDLKEQQMSEENVCGVSGDMWHNVLQFLPLNEIVKTTRVCQSFYFIVNDDRLWDWLLQKNYSPEQIEMSKTDLAKQDSTRSKFAFQKLFAELCVVCQKQSNEEMQYLKPIKRSICNQCLSERQPNRRSRYWRPAVSSYGEYSLLTKTRAMSVFSLTATQIKNIAGIKAPYQIGKETTQYLYGYTKRCAERLRVQLVLKELENYNLLRPVNALTLTNGTDEEENCLRTYIDKGHDLHGAIKEYTTTWSTGKKKVTKKRKRSTSKTDKKSKKKKKTTTTTA